CCSVSPRRRRHCVRGAAVRRLQADAVLDRDHDDLQRPERLRTRQRRYRRPAGGAQRRRRSACHQRCRDRAHHQDRLGQHGRRAALDRRDRDGGRLGDGRVSKVLRPVERPPPTPPPLPPPPLPPTPTPPHPPPTP